MSENKYKINIYTIFERVKWFKKKYYIKNKGYFKNYTYSYSPVIEFNYFGFWY